MLRRDLCHCCAFHVGGRRAGAFEHRGLGVAGLEDHRGIGKRGDNDRDRLGEAVEHPPPPEAVGSILVRLRSGHPVRDNHRAGCQTRVEPGCHPPARERVHPEVHKPQGRPPRARRANAADLDRGAGVPGGRGQPPSLQRHGGDDAEPFQRVSAIRLRYLASAHSGKNWS